MQFINQINFLIKSNANLSIIFCFLKTKIFKILNKNKIKNFKKENELFLKNLKITSDYFSSNAFFFYYFLQKFDEINYLEVGSFEGNSSIFVASKFVNSKIYCVDNWQGTEEYENLNFLEIENNFDHNIKNFKNIIKIKSTSDHFFDNNKFSFNVIYIDGYHLGSQVYKDFKNAWRILSKDGIIIMDDYIWNFFSDIKNNPCYNINLFLSEIKKNYKILAVTNSQIFIQKKC